MKRFITISLLSALTLPMLACIWFTNHNYYLYKIYDSTEFKERVQETCNNNWLAYLGSTETYFWFQPEKIIEAAQQKGDALMISYVQNLQKYLDCVQIEERKQFEWNYPSKEEMAECKQDLQAIRTYALSKTSTRLRSQHALLYMRCNMMLGQHQENINYWENTASKFIETVYKDMMKNIYAGALYKTGQDDRAGELFAEMGDFQSLMTQYYNKRSFLAIQQEYRKNPNAKVLPFLLQDFVNNTQEAFDTDEWQGKLFVRDISKQEAWQMQQFCELVVREGKTETPSMWKSAKAWLEYLAGNKKDAAKDIVAAASLDGTLRMKDCTRELMLYITADQAKPSETFDDYLADELEWLSLQYKDREDEENGGQAFRLVDRLVHKVLLNRYENQPERVAALLDFSDSNFYADYIDTLQVDKVEKYLMYMNVPAKNKLDKFLKSHLEKNNQQTMEELIGTKYMRLCQWDQAIQWLKGIPASFYSECNYAVYVANRDYTVEPWCKRQWLSDDVTYSDTKWKIRENPKLNFAKEMQMIEASLTMLSGKALEQHCYNLAVRYAQASFRGDCWWLMRNGKSVMDALRVNETDFIAKTQEMLQKAALSSDLSLKAKALFAMGWYELYDEGHHWRESFWDQDDHNYVWKLNPQSPQFRAFSALFDLERSNTLPANEYISRCDDYAIFKNSH